MWVLWVLWVFYTHTSRAHRRAPVDGRRVQATHKTHNTHIPWAPAPLFKGCSRMTVAVSPTIRDRLHTLRRGALAQLAASDRIDGGLMRVVADTGATLAAIDAEADVTEAVEPASRAVVLDDNLQIQVAIFTADRQAAAVVLTPIAAVRLAQKLLAAASPKLAPGVR